MCAYKFYSKWSGYSNGLHLRQMVQQLLMQFYTHMILPCNSILRYGFRIYFHCYYCPFGIMACDLIKTYIYLVFSPSSSTRKYTQVIDSCHQGGDTPILVFCSPIFVLSQDASQGTTTKIADGQKSNCLLAGQESISHF